MTFRENNEERLVIAALVRVGITQKRIAEMLAVNKAVVNRRLREFKKDHRCPKCYGSGFILPISINQNFDPEEDNAE